MMTELNFYDWATDGLKIRTYGALGSVPALYDDALSTARSIL